jgi:hypothetical protein
VSFVCATCLQIYQYKKYQYIELTNLLIHNLP